MTIGGPIDVWRSRVLDAMQNITGVTTLSCFRPCCANAPLAGKKLSSVVFYVYCIEPCCVDDPPITEEMV